METTKLWPAHRHAKVDDIFPKGMMVEHST
jgi:hypothetical protein